ncbi:Nuclear pore protein 84/107 [Cordyceps fumosorosea ARSEF 2679]|uniref:Nuclear pore complex protein n=1 Tax=Cordyceps fumosorosea (strain ARSEF 2679) TaxID=1081104 RepID=A0A167WKT4_CORFA|nr:Nuclear pore protein 84/107 [Cordyceps fumosorosea ARSEF 2679]OAA63915.1 Nuclear pore protein 84/107 [Cordyceps fumosorosea ARSEF 2679]
MADRTGAISSPAPVEAGPEVEEFANALDECLAPFLSPAEKKERLLDLPRRYYENAILRLAKHRPKRVGGSHDDIDMDVDEAEEAGVALSAAETKRVEGEAQTWDLIRRLMPLRHAAARENPFITFHENQGAGSDLFKIKNSSGDLLKDLLHKDQEAQERHAVLQWLQANAASGPDIDTMVEDLQQNADRGDVIAHGWLHTRSKIKLRKSVTGWSHLLERQTPNIAESHVNSTGAPLVTNLDPDAVTRQDRKLEPQDDYFERAIWLGCFEHLRRGSSLEELRDWCQERTEMWRAISMSAALFSSDETQEKVDVAPESLMLWRRMCYALACNRGSSEYERAVYGILSGDVASVEGVAKTWDDHLFAHYNALVRTQLDLFALSKCPQDVASNINQCFPVYNAPCYNGGETEKRLMRSLEANAAIKDEAEQPIKALQASVIADDTGHHLFEQGLSIELKNPGKSFTASMVGHEIAEHKYFSPEQHDGLRIVTHVYILQLLMEKQDAEDNVRTSKQPPNWRFTQECIVGAYAEYLRRAGLHELIPLYCSTVEAPRCYKILSRNLIHEDDHNQRLIQLKLVKKAGIDVLQFVEEQANLMYFELNIDAELTKQPPPEIHFRIVNAGRPTSRQGRAIKPDFFGEEEDAIDTKDEHLIRSIEWLALVHEKWPKVFSIGTKAYKYFLTNMHLNAARQLMRRVPFNDMLRRIMEQDEAEAPQINDVRFWEDQLERSNILDEKPEQVMADARNFRDLEAIVAALDSLETIASLVILSAEMPTTNRKFWASVGDGIKAAKENMQPLLKGWLVLSIAEGDEELSKIRREYLPETILAYVSALHFAGTGLSRDNLLESMELATVVAERSSDLTSVFSATKRMTELVEALAACSKALAIATGEKRATGAPSKKLREMGWSRDIWSVKS